MLIKFIGVDGVKGVTTNFSVGSRRLLLTGKMGAGKSAVIDGVHLALCLPTRFGQTGLDRLSPTGNWSVELEFAGDDPVRRLERSLVRNKARFIVNGLQVDRDEYEEACRRVLNVEPHHVSLSEFVGLSGQKRAALFAAMFEVAETDVAGLLASKGISDVASVLRQAALDVDPAHFGATIARVGTMRGAPATLVEAVRQQLNDSTAAERDAKTRLEGLVRRQSQVSHGMSPVDIKARLQAIDEQLGTLRARKKDIELTRQRHEAAQKVVSQAQGAVHQATQQVQAAEALEADGDNRMRTFAATAKQLNELGARIQQRDTDGQAIAERRQQAADLIDQIKRSAKLCDEITGREWNVDQAWLGAEFEQLMEDLEVAAEPTPARLAAVMKFSKEVVTEVLGGARPVLEAKLTEAQSALAAVDEQLRAHKKEVDDQAAKKKELERVRDEQKKALDEAAQAVVNLPAMRDAVIKREQERVDVESKLGQLAVAEDEAMLDAQIEAETKTREGLATQLTELEDSKAVSGQVEDQRVEVAKAEAVVLGLKALLDLCQSVRDQVVKDQLASQMSPFRDAFRAFFGRDVSPQFVSSGQGRSTEFGLTISHRSGVRVPLDLLSDGETVLAAASFLTALQLIRKAGTFLSFNSEALDDGGLQCLIGGLAGMKLDFAVVANNRGAAFAQGNPGSVQGWQVIDMERHPRERS